MRMQLFNNRIVLMCLAVTFSFLITGCSSYNYYSTKKEAEMALLKKNYGKSRNLYALIYKKEKNNSKERTHALWAYYRLGVIHELLGKLRLSRGYYWGDQMKKGFYKSNKKIDWFAKYAWNRLDKGRLPRSLKTILEFEKKGLQKKHKIAKKTKKTYKIINKPLVNQYTSSDDGYTRIFDGSMTRPPARYPEPFKVFY